MEAPLGALSAPQPEQGGRSGRVPIGCCRARAARRLAVSGRDQLYHWRCRRLGSRDSPRRLCWLQNPARNPWVKDRKGEVENAAHGPWIRSTAGWGGRGEVGPGGTSGGGPYSPLADLPLKSQGKFNVERRSRPPPGNPCALLSPVYPPMWGAPQGSASAAEATEGENERASARPGGADTGHGHRPRTARD